MARPGHAQATAFEGKLAGIASVKSGLELGEHCGVPRADLLGADTSGNGRAIVSFGDPGTASNTVTYVPGLGSTLAGAFGDSSRAAALWAQAQRFAPGKTISSACWLGYNTGQFGLSEGL